MSITLTHYADIHDTKGTRIDAPDALTYLKQQHRLFPAGTISNVLEQVVAKAEGNPLPEYAAWQKATKGTLPLYRFSTTTERTPGSDPGLMTALVVEIDAGNGAPEDALDLLLAATAGYEAVLMTSTGHSDQYPAIRLVMPVSPAIPAAMYEQLVVWMQMRVTGASGGKSWLSKQEKNASRAWYVPAGYPEVPGIEPELIDASGRPLDWRTLDLSPPPAADDKADETTKTPTSDLAVTESKCSFAAAARDDAELVYPLWVAAFLLWRGSYLETAGGEVSGQDLVTLREAGRYPARYLTGRTLEDKAGSFTGEAPRKATIAEHWKGCATCPLAAVCRTPMQHGEANKDDLGDVQKQVARWKRAVDAAIQKGDALAQAAAEANLKDAQDKEAKILSRLQSAAAAATPRNAITMDNGNDTELARVWLQQNPSATCSSDMRGLMIPRGDGTGLWQEIDPLQLAVTFRSWQNDGIHFVNAGIDPTTGMPRIRSLVVDMQKSQRAAVCVLEGVINRESKARGVLPNQLPDLLTVGAERGIPYRSGMVGFDGTITPITLDDRLTEGDLMPGDYKPKAKAPRFLRFLSEMLACHDEERARAYAACLQEFAGASLAGQGTRFGKLLLLTGDGCNGKSTLLAVIRRMFIKARVGAVQPSTVNEERHRTALLGKRINIVDDMSARYLGDTGLLKSIITGENPVDGRFLNHEIFTFTPKAGWLAGINTLPSVTDASDGFWRRVQLIPCEVSFLGREDRTLGAELEKEAEGIIAWAVEGLKRLAANAWKGTEVGEDAKEEWRDSANHLVAFCTECISLPTDPGTAGIVSASAMYQIYSEWCQARGEIDKHPMSRLGRHLPKWIRDTRTHTKKGNGYRINLVTHTGRPVRPDLKAAAEMDA